MKMLARLGVAAVLLALAPFVLTPYQLSLATPIIAYGIALIGLNLLFGYGGLLSFGHAMFMAFGAYSVAVLGSRLGYNAFELQLLVAIVVSAVVGLLVGLLCLRHTRIFFSVLTLAFGMVFHSFLFKFYDLTGGESGISVRRPKLFGISLAHLDKTEFLNGPFYAVSAALLLVCFAIFLVILRSPFGLALQASRDNPTKTEYLGARVSWLRLIAFVLSAVYCAIGGAILAVSIGAADPEIAFWPQSGLMIFMIVLGGMAQPSGPLVGAIAFYVLQDWLMAHTPYWRAALGAALIIMVVFAPQGLTGLWRSIDWSFVHRLGLRKAHP